MSRIAGLLHHSDADQRGSLVASMVAASHCDAGWQSFSETSGNATLGWTGWRAPNLTSANGILVAIDGHIYNRTELRCVDGDNDAALVSSLYAEHGFQNMLVKLNGDFTIAIYDPRVDTLWLARDRLGLKPMYYTPYCGGLAFASRPRALLSLPGVSSEANRRFVALFAGSHYRYFDNDPDSSPYRDVFQLPAGHMLRFQSHQIFKTAYWSLQDLPDFIEPEDELAEQYRDLLMDAVSLRLKTAERPAFTLSGGMDSSSVLACAVSATGARQHAFSAVYEDETYDESHEIRSMLNSSVECWHPVAVNSPDVVGLVERMIRVHDEPVATATWLSHFLLCEEVASQGFGSLFGGLGGDELNAGEYEHFFYYFADLRASGQEEQLDREVQMWAHYHDHPIFRKSPDIMEDSLSRLVDMTSPGRCLADRRRLSRYASAVNPEYFNLEDFEPEMDHPFTSYIKNRAYQDIFRETAPCSLRAEDRAETAFAIDRFAPFFDHRLVEFMFRVPGRFKIQDGVTKGLLRRAMRGLLPEETRTRVKKTGWNAPAHMWFSGAGLEPILDLVHSRAFRERGIYNVSETMRLIEEHQTIVRTGDTRENHMMFLWQLVNLELWLSGLDGDNGTPT